MINPSNTRILLKKTNPNALIILLLGLVGILTACSDAGSAPTTAAISAGDDAVVDDGAVGSDNDAGSTGGYPISENVNDQSAYPIGNVESSTPIPAQVEQPPTAGMGNLIGHVISSETQLPVMNVPLQLAEVIRENGQGAYVLDTAQSPFTQADVNGFFVFSSLPPGEYVLVVGSVENDNYELSTQPDGKPLPYKINADGSTDVGTIAVKELIGYETK